MENKNINIHKTRKALEEKMQEKVKSGNIEARDKQEEYIDAVVGGNFCKFRGK